MSSPGRVTPRGYFSNIGMRAAKPRVRVLFRFSSAKRLFAEKGYGAGLSMIVALALLSCLSTSRRALAQADLGTITGVVQDSTGAILRGAQVTLTNEATGVVRSMKTNSEGIYAASALSIGHYTLRVTATGFKAFIRSGIVLNVASTVEADASLTVGNVAQSVVVQANRVQVQSQTADISTIITNTQMNEIPTNGRNIFQLAELVTGASVGLPSFDSPVAVEMSDSIFFDGTRRHNLYLLNGGEMQDGGCTGCMSVAPSQNAIAEASIITNNAMADIGLASGGFEDFSVKSGTRNLHGQLWEFNRNDAYDANDYFAKLSQTPKPELRYNIFGFNAGGPIYIPHLYQQRDKTFFFYNMEWRKLIQGGELYTYTMPAATFNGDFSGFGTIKVPATNDPTAIANFARYGLAPGDPFPNNQIPAGLIDPNVALLLKTGFIPQPNTPDGTHFSSPAPGDTNLREEVLRIDHQVNSSVSLMASFLYDDGKLTDVTAGGGDTYPTVGVRKNSPSYSGQFRLSDTIGPNLLNVTSFNIDDIGISEDPTGNYVIPAGYTASPYFVGVNAENRIPQISIGAPFGVTYTERDLPWSNIYHNKEIKDSLSWIRGKHNFGFGGSYMWSSKYQQFSTLTQGSYNFSGAFTGNSFADFLLGYAANYNQAENQNFVDIATHTADLYAMDNWKPTDRLTVNLGVRWEFQPHAYDVNNALSNFVPTAYVASEQPVFNADGSMDTNGPGFSTVSGVSHAISNTPFYLNGVVLAGSSGTPTGVAQTDFSTPRGLVQTSYNDFAPRLGFEYALTGDSKTVLRGGFGIFYERLAGNDIYDNGYNPPFDNVPSANDVYFSNPATSNVSGKTAAQPVFPAGLQALSYYYPLPATAQYNLGIQRQVSSVAVLSVAYVGTYLYNQMYSSDINTVPLNDPHRLAICGENCGYSGTSYNQNLDRNYPGFSDISYEFTTNYHADYNSLQSTFLIHQQHNLNASVAYTWSHDIDYGSGDGSGFSDPYNFAYDRGNADYDRRQVLQISYFYALPFLRSSSSRLVKSTVAGWQLAGVTTFETGNPFSANLGYDNTGLGGNENSRAVAIAPVKYHKSRQWFSPSSFAAPAPLVFGASGRNMIYGPGLANWDMNLSKVFPLWSEGSQFEFRVESFNVFNHTEFNSVDNSFSDGPQEFGQVTSTHAPRVLQLGGQITF